MPKYVKLTLDIVIGAVLPVVILKYGTAPLGQRLAARLLDNVLQLRPSRDSGARKLDVEAGKSRPKRR